MPSPREFFSKHAQDYGRSESHAHGSDLALLVELLKPQPDEIALDVATGTGFTAMEIAGHVKQVVAVDITPEMLSEAARLAKERRITNLRFEYGDASRLPFEDSSFNIVTTRRAPHHFRDVSKFLREATRVLKSSGRLGIVDMSPQQGTEEFFNQIEILRDSTHTRALTPDEWRSRVEEVQDLQVTHLQTLGERVSFERWLYPVRMGGTAELKIRKKWESAPSEVSKALGVELDENSEIKSWIKDRIVLIANKTKSA